MPANKGNIFFLQLVSEEGRCDGGDDVSSASTSVAAAAAPSPRGTRQRQQRRRRERREADPRRDQNQHPRSPKRQMGENLEKIARYFC